MLIKKFLDYLQLEKNYSYNTLAAYKRDLNQYNIYIIENNGDLKIENADYKIIRSWIVSMVNSNISNRSINRKVSSLKSFFTEALRLLSLAIISLILYYIITKLTVSLLGLKMVSYKNAENISPYELFKNLPNKIVLTYTLFHDFFK